VQELFGDFYRLQNGGAEPTEEEMTLLQEVLRDLEEGGDETD